MFVGSNVNVVVGSVYNVVVGSVDNDFFGDCCFFCWYCK